jgi:dienelactone hydrolase
MRWVDSRVRRFRPSPIMRPTAAVAAAVLAVVSATSCSGTGSGNSSPARIVATPSTALFDAPVSVTITGLPTGAPTAVTATTQDFRGATWSSTAMFTADGSGRLSLSQPSTGGSYRGPDPMGLFETLAPAHPPANNITGVSPFPFPAKNIDVAMAANVNGRTVASTTVTRDRVPADPTKLTLAATGLYGSLYLPIQPSGPKPAVLVLGGSEGGLSTSLQAALLAAHGYPALALAYFGAPGLPATLHNIPLEYFVTALKLLVTQPGVDPQHVLVWGDSRGSEAALLLGAHYPQLVHGVIATVPSGVVNAGYPPTEPPQPAWTLGGAPLPFATRGDYERHDITATSNVVIPVEQIDGPIFLLCAGQDRVWRSCAYTRAISTRLSANHFIHPVTALTYPAAGHLAGGLLPYLPFTGAPSPTDTLTKTGGTELADEQAQADAWPQLLTFLTHQ